MSSTTKTVDIFEVRTDRAYLSDHLWARIDADGVSVGVDDFAQKLAGVIERVRLPTVGQHLAHGDDLIAIEVRRKACGGGLCTYIEDRQVFRSPLAGTVIEVNSGAVNRASLIQEDPYDGGWLVKLKPDPNGDRYLAGAVPADELEAWLGREIQASSEGVEAIRKDWS